MKDQKDHHSYIPELHDEKNILGKWACLFIERPRIMLLLIILVMYLGWLSFSQMPKEINPEIRLPYINITTTYTGASPEEIENLVTDELESRISEIEGIKSLKSTSALGYSSIDISFDMGVDMEKMKNEVKDKVSEAKSSIPDDADDSYISEMETGNEYVLILNLTGIDDYVELKNSADRIKDEIKKIKDVSNVDVYGGLEREIKVIIDPHKLAAYNMRVEQIGDALKTSNTTIPGGNIYLDNKKYNVRTIGKFKRVEDMENVVVSYTGTGPLYIKDIGMVVDGYKEIQSDARTSVGVGTDNPTVKKSVTIVVKRKEGSDAVKIGQEVRRILKDGKGSVYPKEMETHITMDLAEEIERNLGDVFDNAKSGLFLVIIVLYIFIGLSESLVVATVIPLALLGSTIVLKNSGASINTMVLFSMILAVGMLVDNGIVVMENIDRLKMKGASPKDAAKAATNQVAPAILSATLTTLAAFLPMAITSGLYGYWLKWIPITVISALAASFFIAITVTPALSSVFLKNHVKEGRKNKPIIDMAIKGISIISVFVLSMLSFKDKHEGIINTNILAWTFAIIFTGAISYKLIKGKENPLDNPFIKKYGNMLYSIITSKKKKFAVLGVVILLLGGSIMLPASGILKITVFGDMDAEEFNVNIKMPVGTELETTSNITSKVEKILFDYAEMESFSTTIRSPEKARIKVKLVEKEKRKRTSMEIADHCRKQINDIPGADITVGEMKGGIDFGNKDIEVMIYGKNFDTLKAIAGDFTQILKEIDGTFDSGNNFENGLSEIQIIINKEKAALLGLDNRSISMSIRNAVNGLKATTFKINQDEIDVMIRTSKEKLKHKEDFNNIFFYGRNNQPIPFSYVATVKEEEGYSAIFHHSEKRYGKVGANVRNQEEKMAIQEKFMGKIEEYNMPKGYSIGFDREQEEINEYFMNMAKNMFIAMILVYLVLSIQFNSLSQPFVILFSVPLAVIGVFMGLTIVGSYLGLTSLIGMVSLVGIAVNDAIVLVDYINYLRKNGYEMNEAIKETAMTRFIPVMSTTITTVGGILPLTLKNDFYAPMGYAIIFGLSFATLLTLVIVPILYSLVETMKEYFKNRRLRKKTINV
ncbi:MAG: efflux RND transporter permease subunit [Anaeromicrobium sp.]|jgi:HAE1 family hydrophobic/amphiphilic exporter-1|uniref:efflux RND transporter permease subunit n=1 Tax=Anaeromicrobium sp. TaxID=1929132 RepID=UPI0025CE3B34|nr:efflux RND transporter permease subunit [Anaeromicrobium sp.]MCT4595458.1 efflux RND transporter permease subunit [Anaeromicrobium sp.]